MNNAFTAQNRRAIARAQSLIAALPGVRSVVGPAGLLTLSVDAAGRVGAVPLLSGGADEDAAETVRQRLLRRSDAIGWFVSRDGTEVRLLIETENFAAIQGAVAGAAASSGLVLLSGGAAAVPLWPVPGETPGPLGPWSPLVVVVLIMALPAGAAAVACRRSGARALLAALAGGLGAAAPALVAPAARLRDVGFQVGFGAAALILVFATAAGLISAIRATRAGAAGAGDPRGARPSPHPRRLRARLSFVLLLPALALVAAAVTAWPRLTLGTQLWQATSFFFVSVRGDMNQPVVLREIRRLTDFLRGEPGVAHAWSVADLFFATPSPGQDFGSIPSDAARVRAILSRARTDAAVALELTADHGEALIAVRLDQDSGVDRLDVLERLRRYLTTAHRSSLLAVDVTDQRLPPATRAFGRGILAADARERVLRICARSGRNLGQTESAAIERAVRRAALLPSVDPGRMRAEAAGEIDRFLEQLALAEAHVGLPRPAERARLTDQLWAEPPGGRLADFVGPLRVLYGRQLSPAALEARAAELRARLSEARRRHSARINFNEILYGADLPTEGVLSEEVRDATLDAMGPLVGGTRPRGSAGLAVHRRDGGRRRPLRSRPVGCVAAAPQAGADHRGAAAGLAAGAGGRDGRSSVVAGGHGAGGTSGPGPRHRRGPRGHAVSGGAGRCPGRRLCAGRRLGRGKAGRVRGRLGLAPAALPVMLAMLSLDCGGAPWFLGAPLDPRGSIPATTKSETVADHRRNRNAAAARGEKVLELAELNALEDRGALSDSERARFIELLRERARDWAALGRPVPLAEDLRHLARLESGARPCPGPGAADVPAGRRRLLAGAGRERARRGGVPARRPPGGRPHGLPPAGGLGRDPRGPGPANPGTRHPRAA